MGEKVFLETDFNKVNRPLKRGKVRDIFDLGDRLLIITTDRISAYDVVLPTGIPGKGIVLNKISEFWFKKSENIVKNHLITTNVDEYPEDFHPYRSDLESRSMLVKKTKPLPVECIVRGYLSGSAWRDYSNGREICNINLPKGLVESSRLEKPFFTPSTKSEVGEHDENISFEQVSKIVGKELAEKAKNISIEIYEMARDFTYNKGIIIADTKFEFGIDENGDLVLIDEVLTPDSSRFWPLNEYKPGRPQNSLDKQFVRDYLNSINWDRKPPAPPLPETIIKSTKDKYFAILKIFEL